MKKKNMTLLIISLLGITSLFSVSCSQATSGVTYPSSSTNSTVEEEEPYVQSLDIINQPTKTMYNEGEIFNPAGLLLQATWSHIDEETNEHIVEELGQYDITYDKTPLVHTQNSIDVFYENASVSIPITVKDIVVTALKITVNPNMMVFTVEDKFTLEGMVLQATVEGGDVMTVTTGYTVTIEDQDITSEVTGEGLLLSEGNHTVVITYKGKSVSFTVTVYDGINYKVEAEKLLGSSKYPSIIDSDKNYVEPNSTMNFNPNDESHYIISKAGEPASGGAYLGEMSQVGKGFTVHVWSDVAKKAIVSMAASSCVIEEHASGNAWIPTKMKDIQLNQMISITANNISVAINDDVILPGGSLSDVGEGNNGLLWVNWQTVNLGEMNLIQGDNTIYFEIIATMKHGGDNTASGSLNLDYFDVIVQK